MARLARPLGDKHTKLGNLRGAAQANTFARAPWTGASLHSRHRFEGHMLQSARRRLVFVALVLIATACAGAASSGSTSPRRDSTVITAEDMTRVQATNLWDVVHRLHPEWLMARTAATVGSLNNAAPAQPIDVQVFIDSQHVGTSETLKQLVVSTTTSLKYYSAAEAQTRFGAGNLNGVIQVIMTKP